MDDKESGSDNEDKPTTVLNTVESENFILFKPSLSEVKEYFARLRLYVQELDTDLAPKLFNLETEIITAAEKKKVRNTKQKKLTDYLMF